MARTVPIRLALAVFALMLVPAAAEAADPAKGSVSRSAPVAWKGSLFLSYYSYTAFGNGVEAECQAPSCDRFALSVKGAGDLVLKIRQNRKNGESYVEAGFRVTRPDGKVEYRAGGSGPDKDFTWRMKNVTAGDYTVDAVSGWNCCVMVAYDASAALVEPEKAEEPPAEAPPTAGGGQGSSQQGQQQQQGPPEPGAQPTTTTASPPPPTVLAARVARTSARRFARVRRLTVGLRSTGPLQLVTAAITRGRTVLATGRVARLPGDGWVVTRLAKKRERVTPGRYTVTVVGRDNAQRPVVATTTLRITR